MERLFVFARHGESTLNVARVVNGDHTVEVPLTEKGRRESELLGHQLKNVPIDLCIVTRFGRTRETAEVSLAGRDVRLEVEPLFDDIDVGDLEGRSIDDYRAWKSEHTRADAFPNGEEPRGGRRALRPRVPGASRSPESDDPRRVARDPPAVGTQRGGGII